MFFRRMGVCGLVLAALVALSTSTAQAFKTQQCGSLVSNVIITETAASTTSSLAFVVIPGATHSFSVPNSACIKVLFTAETACQLSAALDICDIRAVINGVEMEPAGGGTQVMDSENGRARAHAFEWVARLGEGNYVLRIERKVRNATTVWGVDEWTLDIMVLN